VALNVTTEWSPAIDDSTPCCFDASRRDQESAGGWGGCFVRSGKRHVAVTKVDASLKFDRKSPSSRSRKTTGVERKTVRRSKISKLDDWYEKAALSLAISAKQ
jgi:hypothetical protein